ncbi:MAG: 2-phospho-L-lactate transferase [Anaerolineaceae bacterium]
MKIAALAGGVGGSKLCAGLADVLDPEDLSIIVNIGDDFDHYGLKVCPDLDTVCYTLAGLNNPATGWGLKDETWNLSRGLEILGGKTWFKIGDRDAATHLERTKLLNDGHSLTEVTQLFCQKWGIAANVYPASDEPISTVVNTNDGRRLAFQEYFVKYGCEPVVSGFDFQGIENAPLGKHVLSSFEDADWIIICPSNPWVSIDPITKLPGVEEILESKKVLAVSPLINGKALKGPAAKMYREMGLKPGSASVVSHYKRYLNAFALDESDRSDEKEINQWGIITLLTDIRMPTPVERRRLANELLAFCKMH